VAEDITGGPQGLASRSEQLFVCDASPHAPVSASCPLRAAGLFVFSLVF